MTYRIMLAGLILFLVLGVWLLFFVLGRGGQNVCCGLA